MSFFFHEVLFCGYISLLHSDSDFFLGSTAFLAASLSFLKKWGYCFRRDEGYFGVLISFGAF